MKSSETNNKEVKFEEAEIVETKEKDSLWQRAKKFANDHKVAFVGGAAAIGLAILKFTDQRKVKEEVYQINDDFEEVTEEDQVSES